MSIISRNSLKAEFISGTAATQSKFVDVFDSHYNIYEDSVLMGPVGITGTYGLVGPAGPTTYNGLLGPSGATHNNGLLGPTGPTFFNGLFINTDVSPTGLGGTSAGISGSVVFNGPYMYVCVQSGNWLRFTGATSF